MNNTIKLTKYLLQHVRLSVVGEFEATIVDADDYAAADQPELLNPDWDNAQEIADREALVINLQNPLLVFGRAASPPMPYVRPVITPKGAMAVQQWLTSLGETQESARHLTFNWQLGLIKITNWQGNVPIFSARPSDEWCMNRILRDSKRHFEVLFSSYYGPDKAAAGISDTTEKALHYINHVEWMFSQIRRYQSILGKQADWLHSTMNIQIRFEGELQAMSSHLSTLDSYEIISRADDMQGLAQIAFERMVKLAYAKLPDLIKQPYQATLTETMAKIRQALTSTESVLEILKETRPDDSN